MALKREDLDARELLAYVQTASEAAHQWIERGVAAETGDHLLREDAAYFGRLLITRGLDRLLLLDHTLQRDDTRGLPAPDRLDLRAARAYGTEARDYLEAAGQLLDEARRAVFADERQPTALKQTLTAVIKAEEWLEQVAERLPAVVAVERDAPHVPQAFSRSDGSYEYGL